MTTTIRRITSAGLVALLLVGSGAAPAAAYSGGGACATVYANWLKDPGVETLRAVGDCEVNRRLTDLRSLSSDVTASKLLTDPHKATLQSTISSDESGLIALKATIDGDTTLATLRADISRIWRDYRVYLLLFRQAYLTRGADGVDASVAHLIQIRTKLNAAIADAKAAGKDTSAAQAQVDAMTTALNNASAAVGGMAAEVLALTPAQYNAGQAEPILRSDRADLAKARNYVRAARDDARAAVRELEALAH